MGNSFVVPATESARRRLLSQHRDIITNCIPAALETIRTDDRTTEQSSAVVWDGTTALRKKLENHLPGLIIHSGSYDAVGQYFHATIHWAPFSQGYEFDDQRDARAECEVHFRKNLKGADRVQLVWKLPNITNLQ